MGRVVLDMMSLTGFVNRLEHNGGIDEPGNQTAEKSGEQQVTEGP
jgi:hypothetical protein